MKPDYIENIEDDEITTPEDNDNDSKDSTPVKIMVSLIAKVDYKLTN